MSTKIIPLASILVDEERQRKIFPEEQAAELRQSILGEHGLLCPIFVRPSNKEGMYHLIAGERRFRAVSTITVEYAHGEMVVPPGHIPAVVKYFDTDMSAMEAELHENIMRLNLTWQEEAEAIARLHKLKQSLNPQHTIGMTADLIEQKESPGDYPLASTYRKVNASLLVTQFLEDPEVAKAPNITTANRIVSRKLEEEQLAKLRELSKKAEEQAKLNPPQPSSSLTEDLLDLPQLPRKKDRVGKLIEGDTLVELSFIPDNSINVVITDPPYGVGVESFNDGGRGTQRHNYSEDNFRELHEFMIKELDRICTLDAHVYIFCDPEYYYEMRSLFSESWWVRRKPIIWSKGQMGKLADGEVTGYRTVYECVLYAKRGKRPCSKVISDVITIPDDRNKLHAAQKPVELYSIFLAQSAIMGDTILDPFAGSGTIFRAARQLMLKPIGIENNEHNIELCKLAQEDSSISTDLDLSDLL